MTPGLLTLLRPLADDRPVSPPLEAVVDPGVSAYVSAPGVEPVRIRPLHHRPRHPAPYIPIGDRFPGPGVVTDQTQRPDLTYEDFLALEPAAAYADGPEPAALP